MALIILAVALPTLVILRRLVSRLFANETTIQPPESYGAAPQAEPGQSAADGPAMISPVVIPSEPDAPSLRILDYGFLHSGPDGPADPLNFYDELRLKLLNPGDAYQWEATFYVCTPPGLQSFMERDRWQYIFGADHIIVPKFDVPLILDAVLDFYETMGRSEIHQAPRPQEAL